MQLYQSNSDHLSSILNADLYVMLGLHNLPEEEKDKFSQKVEKLTLQYFIQEKIGNLLSEEEMEELMKLPSETEEDGAKFLQRVGEMIPDASTLYIEAGMEVKARLVQDHYKVKQSDLEEMLQNETDSQKKSLIEKDIDECKRNLVHAEKGEWGLINQVDLEGQV